MTAKKLLVIFVMQQFLDEEYEPRLLLPQTCGLICLPITLSSSNSLNTVRRVLLVHLVSRLLPKFGAKQAISFNHPRAVEITTQIGEMVPVDNESFYFVEHTGFKHLMALLE